MHNVFNFTKNLLYKSVEWTYDKAVLEKRLKNAKGDFVWKL